MDQLQHEQVRLWERKSALLAVNTSSELFVLQGFYTYTAAGCYCDLDCVPPRLAYVFQVQGFVGRLVVAPLDSERCSVDADLDRCRPVGVHLTILMMIALKLQLQV